jgi:hypothetical protein
MVAQLDISYVKHRPWKLWSRLISYLFFEGRPITTKGRFINPALFLFFKLLKAVPIYRITDNPIFIIGMGRSGTTILGKVLSMHKDVGYLNEPKAMWHSIYPNEDLVGNYSLNNASYKLGPNDATENIENAANKLYCCYKFFSLSKRVVDKYPEMVFRVRFLMKIFPSAKFVFLVRNGYDTCGSIDNWSKAFGNETNSSKEDWWGLDNRKWNYLISQIATGNPFFSNHVRKMKTWSSHLDKSAVEWTLSMQEGVNLMNDFPETILRLNYEELCEEPKQKLCEMSDFLDLSYDQTFIDYGKEVLKPVKRNYNINFHPLVKIAFDETMQSLGYE